MREGEREKGTEGGKKGRRKEGKQEEKQNMFIVSLLKRRKRQFMS